MKASLVGAVALFVLGGLAQAQQKPPAGRAGLDPASRNKVVNVMARDNMGEKDARANIEREMVTSPGGKSCTTNVGVPKVNEGTGGIGNRYGAGNSDQVTVVRGSVINICK
ncbi:MAG: hypothetical protein RSD57_13270 [Comamonas sp.]